MLRPSNEVLNSLKTISKALGYHMFEFVRIWLKLNPEIVNIGNYLSVFLDDLNVAICVSLFDLLFFLFFVTLRLQLQMSE